LFTTSAPNSWPSTILCQDLEAGPPNPSSSWKKSSIFGEKNVNIFEKSKNLFFDPELFHHPHPFKPLF